MEDRVLPGQSMQWSGIGCEVFHVAPVIAGETQEGADFGGVFGRANLSDGGDNEGSGRRPSLVTQWPR